MKISAPQLKSLFVNNYILPIYYLHNAKNEFNKNIDFEIENSQNECDISIDTMKEFLIIPNQNHLLCQMWEHICPSLVGYLIQQCYEKINQRQAHISFAIDNSSKKQLLSNDEYIEIGNKGIGSIYKTGLIYHIKEEKAKQI